MLIKDLARQDRRLFAERQPGQLLPAQGHGRRQQGRQLCDERPDFRLIREVLLDVL